MEAGGRGTVPCPPRTDAAGASSWCPGRLVMRELSCEVTACCGLCPTSHEALFCSLLQRGKLQTLRQRGPGKGARSAGQAARRPSARPRSPARLQDAPRGVLQCGAPATRPHSHVTLRVCSRGLQHRLARPRATAALPCSPPTPSASHGPGPQPASRVPLQHPETTCSVPRPLLARFSRTRTRVPFLATWLQRWPRL